MAPVREPLKFEHMVCVTLTYSKSTPASYEYHGALGGSRPVLVRGQKRGRGSALSSLIQIAALSRVRTHDANQPSLRSHLLPAFMSRPDHGAAQNMECKRSRSVHSALTTRPSSDAPRPNPLNEVALCSRARAFPAPGSSPTACRPFKRWPASVLVACSSCAPVTTPLLFELHSDRRALDQRTRLDEQLLELA